MLLVMTIFFFYDFAGRNGSFLRVIHCRRLAEEYDPKTAKVQELGE